MSRSIHTTKKDLKRERLFTSRDGDLPNSDAITELEGEHLKKLLHKDNEQWRREAAKQNTPAVAELRLTKGTIVRALLKKRAPKPAHLIQPEP